MSNLQKSNSELKIFEKVYKQYERFISAKQGSKKEDKAKIKYHKRLAAGEALLFPSSDSCPSDLVEANRVYESRLRNSSPYAQAGIGLVLDYHFSDLKLSNGHFEHLFGVVVRADNMSDADADHPGAFDTTYFVKSYLEKIGFDKSKFEVSSYASPGNALSKNLTDLSDEITGKFIRKDEWKSSNTRNGNKSIYFVIWVKANNLNEEEYDLLYSILDGEKEIPSYELKSDDLVCTIDGEGRAIQGKAIAILPPYNSLVTALISPVIDNLILPITGFFKAGCEVSDIRCEFVGSAEQISIMEDNSDANVPIGILLTAQSAIKFAAYIPIENQIIFEGYVFNIFRTLKNIDIKAVCATIYNKNKDGNIIETEAWTTLE